MTKATVYSTDPGGETFQLQRALEELVADARFTHPQRQITLEVEPAGLQLAVNPLLLQRSLGT